MCYLTLFDCWFAWLVLSCLDGWLIGCLDIKIYHQLQMKHWAKSTQRALTCINKHSYYLTGGDMVMLMMIMVVKMMKLMQMIMTKARQWAVK